jgi:hypothetical protein
MGMVAPRRGIGSAFFIHFGRYGDVSNFAREQGVSRQWVYREAQRVTATLEGSSTRQQIASLQSEVTALRRQVAEQQRRLDVAVVLDEDKQAEFACVGQSCGVTLPQAYSLLKVLIGKPLSVASLGRRTQVAGEKAGQLLEVFDSYARPLVRDGAGDEIYVKDPVLMVVEQESLCWVCGKLSETVDGEAWSQEFVRLPNLEQLARDGGNGLARGVALVNAQRQEQGQEPIVDQGDHFHALRNGGVGLRRAQLRASTALAEAETKQKKLDDCARRGQSRTVAALRATKAWQRAERAMDAWQETERIWQQTKDALLLITPQGELNSRAKAEAMLAQTLPQLPDSDFAKSKRHLRKPEMLNYLDRLHDKLAKLPVPEEVKQAAIQQETLRRRPDLLQGESAPAAALRGVMLVCAVILSKSGKVGQEAAGAVRAIFRRAYRASSLVECINSVLRMQQAQHRKMSQGLLNLKRLYWNCHTFRTGRRRNTTPYQRLGVPWPKGMKWWDVLKLTPEQLREKLSTAKMAM